MPGASASSSTVSASRADMTSAAEYEAALVQLEEDPPDIRQYNANIREERWTNFSLEGVRFPAMTVDVIQRGEALAIFESDLIIHFQQISRAALYVRALLGGIKRTLEIYRRVDDSTKNFPWSAPTTEEKWHTHAEGVLMVALTTLNLPTEAWKSARLLRAVPNCRLVLMLAYHMLSPALSVEETGLMAYSPDTSRGWTVHCANYDGTSQLEMRRKKVGGDRRKTSYSKAVASVIHQNTFEAFGSKQEVELYVSATVKHYTDDESKFDRDCGTLRVCRSDLDPLRYCCGTFPGCECVICQAKTEEG